MPRPDAAFGRQQQQPGQKLISDFESLRGEVGDDAAVEFVAKNKGTIGTMDSEEAFDLLQKMPRRTQDAGMRTMLQGALQTTLEKSMQAREGTDFVSAFEKRGAAMGITFLERNLDKVDPAQVPDLVSKLMTMESEFSRPRDANEESKQRELIHKRDALIGKLEAVQAPEAKREGAGRPNLHIVKPEEAQRIEVAQARVDTIREAFDSYSGSLNENTRGKVERWQRELYELRDVIGEEVDALYEQMNDYVRAVKKASEARQTIATQGRRQMGPKDRIVSQPQAAATPAKKWYKFW